MKNLLFYFLLLGCSGLSAQVVEFVEQSAPDSPPLNFSFPVDVTGAGDGSNRLFIVERVGRIKVFDQTTRTVLPDNFLDVTNLVRSGGERGLLGLAFHPDYANNGYFYVNYTASSGGTGLASGTTVISRFTNANPANNLVDGNTELRIITVNQTASNHNAGDLAFGPDGYLYIPLGDGGGGNDPFDAGQNPTTLLGKMLRLDVDNPAGGQNYSIPADNPFVGSTDTLPEIWALGLRNPWRISFDRLTGDLWIADVGQNDREEINFQPAGSAGGLNYGWDCREGFIQTPRRRSADCIDGETYEQPIFDYAHDPVRNGSVTGGFVYRGQHADDLVGKYIFAEYLTDEVFQLGDPTVVPIMSSRQPISDFGSVSTFGEDDDGNLFIMSLAGGLYEVTSQLALPVDLLSWTATATDKSVSLKWEVASENKARDYVIERSQDGRTFQPIATIPAKAAGQEGAVYVHQDDRPLLGESFYQLRQRDLDGNEQLFSVRSVRYLTEVDDLIQIGPNPNNGRFSVRLMPSIDASGLIHIYQTDGKLLLSRTVEPAGGSVIDLDISRHPTGVYRVEFQYGDRQQILQVIKN